MANNEGYIPEEIQLEFTALHDEILAQLGILVRTYNVYHDEAHRREGHIFGLRQTGADVHDCGIGLRVVVYRMDDAICEALEVPVDTCCYWVSASGAGTMICLDDFRKSADELRRIAPLLKSIVPMMLIQNEWEE